MSVPPKWRRYARFWRADPEADVDDELRTHFELRIEELRAQGVDADEATRRAIDEFGDVAMARARLYEIGHRMQCRRRRTASWDTLTADLRYGLRALRRQPVFALTVVLVLALGIGATTAMFSVVDAVLLRPLPFAQDDRLVAVEDVHVGIAELRGPRFVADIADLRAMRDVVSHAAVYAPGGINLTDDVDPTRLRAAMVTPDFFSTLGVSVAFGRGFTVDEGTPEGPSVVILSDGFWRRRFGGDTSVLGRDLRLHGVPHRVVGVMPPGFSFPEAAEVWIPLPTPIPSRRLELFQGIVPMHVVARLAPGITIPQADAHVRSLVRRHQPPEMRARPFATPPVASFRDTLVGSRSTALLVLLGATALVLLVACANLTNLLLARAATRRDELTLRTALGASRLRLVRQLLTESAVLGLTGGVLGVLLAYVSLDALRALVPPTLLGAAPPRVDGRVLGFAAGTALLTGIAFGLWPALGASRTSAHEVIKRLHPGVAGTATAGRRIFVVAELALALMLAVGAGLMLRSLQTLLAVDPGLRPDAVATLAVALPRATYPTPETRAEFHDRVLARLAGTPGVTAAVVDQLPLRGERLMQMRVLGEGQPEPGPNDDWPSAQIIGVSPDYFRVLGIPFLHGRGFTTSADSTRPEVVISAALASRIWGEENPIGRRLEVSGPGAAAGTVVGVVGDVRTSSLDAPAVAQLYTRFAGRGSQTVLVARGTVEPEALIAELRHAVRNVDPSQAVHDARLMTDVIAATLAPRRTSTLLLTTFGAIALGLAAIGVYGVIAYGVATRAREIGIRVALGASRRHVLRLVLGEGLALAAAGVALGLAGAWALRRVMTALVYGITASDTATYAVAATMLFIVAALATLVPTRRALRVDPAQTMRVD